MQFQNIITNNKIMYHINLDFLQRLKCQMLEICTKSSPLPKNKNKYGRFMINILDYKKTIFFLNSFRQDKSFDIYRNLYITFRKKMH